MSEDVKTAEQIEQESTEDPGFDFGEVVEMSESELETGDPEPEPEPKPEEDTEEQGLPNRFEKSQEKEGDEDEEEEEPVDPNPNVIAAYEFYRDHGIVPEMEDFQGTEEELQELMIQVQEKNRHDIAKTLIERTPDFAKPLMHTIIERGTEITEDEFSRLYNATKRVAEMPEAFESAEQAEPYLFEKLIEEGESRDEAIERIKIYRQKNTLLQRANKYLEQDRSMPAQEANEILNDYEARERAEKQYQKNFHDAMVEYLEEYQWHDSKKQEVYQEFYSGGFKQRLEHMMQNPAVLPVLVDFAAHYDPNHGTLDMEAWKNQAFSPSNQEVKRNLESYFSKHRPQSGRPVNEEEDPSEYEFVD